MTTAIRYSFGGDEHLFVELSESMSLEAFFRGLAMTRAVQTLQLPGIHDICLANASFQIRFDPDVLPPDRLLAAVQGVEDQAVAERQLATRLIEIPVLYNDPWTHETLMRFRDRHQDPTATDLEYAARIGYAMIGTVISSDLDLIGQLQPNQKARFVAVTLEDALAARRVYKERLQRLEQLLAS